MPPSTRRSARSTTPTTGLTAFVTVGTTKFDALVDAVDDPEFEAALLTRGYTHIAVQAGAGASSRPPTGLLPGGAASGVTARGLHVAWFDYEPSLADRFQSASLVISHAGAGSLFEALTASCTVVAVPNASLMHNHQAELADALASENVLIAATPATLAAVVADADFEVLQPYVHGDATSIVDVVDGVAGRVKGGRR